MIYLLLFVAFLKMGLFGFGGGYAIITLIYGEVVTNHHWIGTDQFTDIVAISQMTPGPIGINSATYIGYSAVLGEGYGPWMAVLGSVVATFALVLPSFVLMLAISRMLLRYKDHPRVKCVFAVLRPTVVGMIAAASLLLFFEPGELKLSAENFGEGGWQIGCSLTLFALTFVASRFYKMSPIALLCCSAIAGLLLF